MMRNALREMMNRLLAIILAACCALVACAQAAEHWAQVNTSIAHLRSEASSKQEMVSQEFLGMPVKILQKGKSWSQIQTTDGYKGWMLNESLEMKTPAQMAQWRKSPRLVVTALQEIKAYDSPEATGPRSVVTDLLPCDIVEGSLLAPQSGRVEITLPDGRKAWADASSFTSIEEWANQPFNAQNIIDRAYAMIGTPYIWGGNSAKMTDCSGLTKQCYLSNGIFLLRDASMQVNTGKRLNPADWRNFETADLIFFSNSSGRVSHVALYDKDGYYIHSSGIRERVGRNSLDPKSPDFGSSGFSHAVRIHGMEGTKGIVKAANHPWLF